MLGFPGPGKIIIIVAKYFNYLQSLLGTFLKIHNLYINIHYVCMLKVNSIFILFVIIV